MKSVLGRIHHKMSHVSLCIIHKGTQLCRADCNANGMIQIILGGMLRAYKNRLHVESRREKHVLQGPIKNKYMGTDSAEDEQISPERRRKQTVKPKVQCENDCMLEKQGYPMQFVISNSCDSVGQVQSLMLKSLLQAAAGGSMVRCRDGGVWKELLAC